MSRYVYKLGQRVRTRIGGIEALITGVCMRSDSSYELSYFVGGQHHNIWLYDFEFEAISEKQKAGFKHYDECETLLIETDK